MSTSVFISSVITNNSLEILHSKVIRVTGIRSIEEDTNVQILHFIISDVLSNDRKYNYNYHDAWSEERLFWIRNGSWSEVRELAKGTCWKFYQLFVTDISCSWNSEVWSNEMGFVEFFDLVSSDIKEVFSNTIRWLTNEVISERILMDEVSENGLLVLWGIIM